MTTGPLEQHQDVCPPRPKRQLCRSERSPHKMRNGPSRWRSLSHDLKRGSPRPVPARRGVRAVDLIVRQQLLDPLRLPLGIITKPFLQIIVNRFYDRALAL